MNLYYQDEQITLYQGDALEVAKSLPAGSVDCIVTSPPYFGLRDYGVEGQYGLEKSPAEYVETMRGLFSELRRVLSDDGSLWLNIGDSYAIPRGGGYNHSAPSNVKRRKNAENTFNGQAQVDYRERVYPEYGCKPKNLLGIPWRVALALQDDGWILRNAIVWNKPNAMPEPVTNRVSKRYEMVFMLSKKPKYWFDLDPIREPSGRNPGDVWNISTKPFKEAHFATFPPELPKRCILAGCKPGGVVLDPFSGSSTTGMVAVESGRKYVGIDLNSEYLDLSLRTRLKSQQLQILPARSPTVDRSKDRDDTVGSCVSLDVSDYQDSQTNQPPQIDSGKSSKPGLTTTNTP